MMGEEQGNWRSSSGDENLNFDQVSHNAEAPLGGRFADVSGSRQTIP